MRRLLWFEFVDHRDRDWRVWFSHHRWCSDLRGCSAITLFEPRDVYIESSLYRRSQDESLNHELCHVVLTAQGRPANVPAKSPEERLIRRLSPSYYAIAVRMGLRWPDRPAGYDSIVRAARRLERLAEEEA